MFDVFVRVGPASFLEHAGSWLREREDHHNLMLSLAYGRLGSDVSEPDALWAVIEHDGAVVGCAIRTPPHKVLVTDLPVEAAPDLARVLAAAYSEIPAVLGPPATAEAVAMAWTELRGGGWRPGMEMGVYRLDSVIRPEGSGRLRAATPDDAELAIRWGEGFTRDAGMPFPTARETVLHWIDSERLYMWEDEGMPVSIAVAHGETRAGVRIGYVYTPPEYRRRGYASVCVADLSQKMLDEGRDFCVLYTDMSNPTSNAIYRTVGYELIAEVRDYDLTPEELL